MLSEKHWRILRYLVSGATATAVNFAVLFSLTEFFHVWYIISSIAGLVCGFTTSFILQKFWTFENKSLERVHIQFPLHAALSLLNVGANTISLYILVEYAHVWYLAAQGIDAVFLAIFNYFVYKHIIFTQ